MKLKWIAVLGIVFLTAQVSAAQDSILKTDKDRESYAIGIDLARNLKRQAVVAQPEALAQGIRDELSGAKLLMSEEEIHQALTVFETEMKKRRAQTLNTLAAENKKAGEAFLAQNKTKKGVVTLPDGLQYKIIKEGTGKKPTEADTVQVSYRGTLINGMEFDNSYTRGQPAAFKVSGVIPGWTEALKLMPVGSKWELYIPANLAYGERGMGRLIGPNSTLIFEIELLAIK